MLGKMPRHEWTKKQIMLVTDAKIERMNQGELGILVRNLSRALLELYTGEENEAWLHTLVCDTVEGD